MKKIAIIVSLFITCILVLITTTNTGLQLIVRAIEYKLPGLSLEKINGRLIGNVEINNLNFENPSVSLNAKQISMKINLIKGFTGKLEFRKIILNDINVNTHYDFSKKQSKKKPLNIKKIQKFIQINQAQFKNLDLKISNQISLHFKRTTLKAFTPKVFLEITATPRDKTNTTIKTQIKQSKNTYEAQLVAKSTKAIWRTQAIITPEHILGTSIFNDKSFATINFNRKNKSQSRWLIQETSLPLNLIDPNLPLIQEISGSGLLKNNTFSNQLYIRGKFLSQLFSLSITSETLKKSIHSNINIKYGLNHIDLKATKNKTLRIFWKASLSNINKLLNFSIGNLNSEGKIYISNGKITSSGSLKATTLSYLSIKAKALDAMWGAKKQRPTQAAIIINHIKYHKILINKISIHCKEAINYLTVKINATQGKKSFSANANISQKTHSIHLNDLKIEGENTWQLEKTVIINWSNQNFTLKNPLNLKNKNDYISIKANLLNNKWSTYLYYKGSQLQSIINWINPNLIFHGDINFNLNASGVKSQLSHSQFQLKTKNNSIKNGSIKLNLGGIDFKGEFSPKKGLTSILKVSPPNNKVITAHFSLPKFNGHLPPTLSEEIRGELNWSGPISVIENYIPKIFQPEGMLGVQAKISGTLNKPDLKTNIQIKQGSLDIPQYGIELKKIQSSIWSTSNIIHIESKIFIDQKPLSITGKYNLLQREGVIHLQANQIQFWNTLAYQFTASPKLDISINNKDIYINGKISINKGVVRPPNFNQILSMPSETEIITKPNSKRKPSTWTTQLLINIDAEKNLLINTMGLKGAASGKLTLKKQKHQPIYATGSLNLAPNTATFSVSGQTLKVPSGALIFSNSPINNPNVNIHVSRKLNQNAMRTFRELSNEPLTVGMNITGYLNNLNINFFSTPIDLPQEKILSYLVVGQSISNNTSANIPALLQVVNQIGGRNDGGNNLGDIQNQVQKKLGLSEMTVESQDLIDSLGNTIDHQTSVVLGKHILPNVYIRYNIGLLDPINTWQIRYILNHRWSIQSETNVRGTGFDLFYRIERGRTN